MLSRARGRHDGGRPGVGVTEGVETLAACEPVHSATGHERLGSRIATRRKVLRHDQSRSGDRRPCKHYVGRRLRTCTRPRPDAPSVSRSPLLRPLHSSDSRRHDYAQAAARQQSHHAKHPHTATRSFALVGAESYTAPRIEWDRGWVRSVLGRLAGVVTSKAWRRTDSTSGLILNGRADTRPL
jgi:hypothetical protein